MPILPRRNDSLVFAYWTSHTELRLLWFSDHTYL